MFNFGQFVIICREVLGEAGAEALSDAVNYYLARAKNEEFGCWEDQLILYSLLMAFDADGLNNVCPEFDALRGLRRSFDQPISLPVFKVDSDI